MNGRSLLFLTLLALGGFALYRAFSPDTSDPATVIERYLNNWKIGNGAAVYLLLSSDAKYKLQEHGIRNAVGYHSYFTDSHRDLRGWQMESQRIGASTARFVAKLSFTNIVGQQQNDRATFYVVREGDSWRVDGWEMSNVYALP
ncbi:MAG: hypothetical protein ABIJ61_08710 [bacterium]